MLLEPGPIPAITHDWYRIGTQTLEKIPDDQFAQVLAQVGRTENDANFSGLVTTELKDLPPMEKAMDLIFDPTVPPDLCPPDDTIAPDLAELDTIMKSQGIAAPAGTGDLADAVQRSYDVAAQWNPANAVAKIDANKLLGDHAMAVAAAETPAETFQPVPAALGGPIAGAPPPGVSTIQITLVNLSRPGAATFQPGDDYQVNVQLLPAPGVYPVIAGVEVWINSWKGVTPEGLLDLGATDQFGGLAAKGTWGLDAVGTWGAATALNFPDGSHKAGPTLTWVVDPIPASLLTPALAAQLALNTGFHPVLIEGTAPKHGAVSVVLTNDTAPGSLNFQINDKWTLTIDGGPGQDVLISAIQNGNPLPWYLFGKTSNTGQFVLRGAMDDPIYVGTWVEFYQVGSIRYSGDVTFNVEPVLG